jgi:hypothetical protein
MNHVGGIARTLGQKMGPMQPLGHTMMDGKYGKGIKAQKDHVHEVFLGDGRVGEPGQHKSDPAKPPGTGPETGQFRDEHGVMFADNDHDRPTLAINDQTDLSGDILAEQSQFPGLFQ